MEDTLRGRLDLPSADVHGTELGLSKEQLAGVKRVYLLACGTSHHAAMVGRHYVESIARIPATVELASEFRAREPIVDEGDLVVAVSQSARPATRSPPCARRRSAERRSSRSRT